MKRKKDPALVAWMMAPLAVLLMSCATTTLYKAQGVPEFQSSEIHRVLVISLSQDVTLRQILENEFVRQWRKRGVEAMPSHQVLPPGTPLQKARVGPLAKGYGYDTVSVTQLLGTSKIDPHIPGETFDVDASTDDANLARYFQAVVASPSYANDYHLAAVSTRLYHVTTEKLVWSGTSQTLVAEDIRKLIPSYVKVILEALYEKP